MPRNFTKYPNSYVKASTSQEDLEQIILDAVTGTGTSSGYKVGAFTNLVFYMAGYKPEATLGEFIEAYKHLMNEGLINIPWD